MGTVFKKQSTRAVPAEAEIVQKGGKRFARWRMRGKIRTAPLTTGVEGGDRIVTESSTYYAKYRDASGEVLVKPTGCRDRQAAEQLLKKWEREVEQIKSGTLDRKALDVARLAIAPVEEHLAAYERSLIAAEVSDTYRANVLRAVRRVAADCEFATAADFDSTQLENWLVDRVEDGMGARSRNYYRQSVITFANWCIQTSRLAVHDFDRLPKADEKADPRRQRRALTEDEVTRVLAVAVTRPLSDARTVRRGKRKGEASADLRPATVARLEAVGRERALIYKTLLLTGLRRNELRTLTVGQLDLTPKAAFLQLNAGDEKNGEGNVVAIRDDLAADLSHWLANKLDVYQSKENRKPIPTRLPPETPVFTVPTGLRLILDRDLRAAGIPKRDDRGRTIDVHAMRTTFGTLLSRAGVAPRTAQAAMRHSDLKLTMGVYTDPRLLDVRGAVEKLPTLPLPSDRTSPPSGSPLPSEPLGGNPSSVAPAVAPTPFIRGQFGSFCGSQREVLEPEELEKEIAVTSCGDNKNPPVTLGVTRGQRFGPAGFEPTTSCTPSQRLQAQKSQRLTVSRLMNSRLYIDYTDFSRKRGQFPGIPQRNLTVS
ncbi:tyrosine-type recombinase/integrase [Fimbriiglobus ruber]|uniref:Uncharacterized protein n=1 Tax=Fimbriiglobus ruber TaxID=1908690 RepID=A0A225DRV1_9BACT|nr:site-specific integrase [Fimbriiglobus ruber]OWK44031.1 hypothetical protein FRUB_03630 [Fimbriiglobus ruber]